MPTITKSETPVIEMYDTASLALKLKCSESQLEKARCNRTLSIPFVRIGKSVRYPAQAVAAWIDGNLVRQ
jgi:hypothetical protein